MGTAYLNCRRRAGPPRSTRGAAGALALALGACIGEPTVPPGPVPATAPIAPTTTAVAPGATAAFTAKNAAGAAVAVTWMVNGVSGGSAAVGTISASGVYTAPSTIPAADSVVVTAASTADALHRSATVFFVPSFTQVDYSATLPRVVDVASPGRVRLFIVPAPSVDHITYLPSAAGAASIPLSPVGNHVFMLDLSTAQAVAGYQVGALHARVGSLDYRDVNDVRVKLTGFGISVRDAGMPDVPITTLAADAQETAYVLNLRADAVSLGTFDAAVIARALQLLGDRFDQVALVANVSSNNNRYHVTVRNAVGGIGKGPIDVGAAYGSPLRLQGICYFPIDDYFDAGETAMSHEFGHQWINFAAGLPLSAGVPHWPPSNIANGVMGFSVGGTGGQGGTFPYTLVPVAGGQYRVDLTSASTLFTAWDLYLMGLLPSDSVPPALVLPAGWTAGGTSTVTTYTIAEYIAAQGARIPAWDVAPHAFTIAVVVLSYGRLLTPSEMAFYHANAARAEATTALPYSIGFAHGTTSPFFVATGGRATLKSSLDP